VSPRVWIKGANGLWHTHDPVIARQVARKLAKEQAEREKAAKEAAKPSEGVGDL
jgi:hypothetical protein